MEIIAAEPEFDHIVSSHPRNILVFPGLELRLKERTVHRNGELISMTHREFATLVYLANHPSWVFSASQIYEAVWNADGENCGTAVASVIGQIRRKLTPDMPKAFPKVHIFPFSFVVQSGMCPYTVRKFCAAVRHVRRLRSISSFQPCPQTAEKIFQHLAAFFLQNALKQADLMIKCRFLQQVID